MKQDVQIVANNESVKLSTNPVFKNTSALINKIDIKHNSMSPIQVHGDIESDHPKDDTFSSESDPQSKHSSRVLQPLKQHQS